MRELVHSYKPLLGVVVLCQVLGLSRATLYRKQAGARLSSGVERKAPPSDLAPLAPPPALEESLPPQGQGGRVATAPPAQVVVEAKADAARDEAPPVSEVSVPAGEEAAVPAPEAGQLDEPGTLVCGRSPRALSAAERHQVLEVLHEPRFVDKAPAEVYATLLDEDRYLCSERTMYRILEEAGEVRERRDQLRHPSYNAPQLLATQPNELWSWDITKLLGPAKWTYFYLYVILDVFSRYVVGWMVAEQELATLAHELIEQTCQRQQIQRDQLTLHADRGSSMTSKTVALLLADLGVTKTHSRPHVSDDNPFSESQFKTLKYRPGFPDRFGSIEHSRTHCREFFEWYNNEHRHSGIGLLTPHDVHYGLVQERLEQRARVLAAAHAAHPERFVQGAPRPQRPPTAVWINKPKQEVPQSDQERV
jgi:putative transposase